MRRALNWSLPAGLALAITWLSHQPRYPFDLALPYGLDKVAHALGFGSLAALLDRALRHEDGGRPVYRRHLLVFGTVALFGLLDEGHQSFVPGRDASLLDALADAVGAGLGLLATLAPGFRSRRLGPISWRRGQERRPDPARPLILVADPHWQADLSSLESATLAHPEADWLFLGDVFDVWVGIPGMESPAQAAFLAWVDRRRAAGRWVGLWLGNREYFLDRHAARFDLMGEGLGGRLAGEGLAFEHGDLVNTADGAYRTWNLLSRSGPLWLAFSLLPARRAAALAATLEARLRTTNQTYKLAFPREAFAQAAAEAAPDTFITGHFHTHEEAGNGTALPWAHGGEFWVWQAGRLAPLQSSRNEASSSANPGSSS